jgi:DNA-binding NarL/FixJ family response regulator
MGFCGYIARDVSLDEFEFRLVEAVRGSIRMPTHIVEGLMRAIYTSGTAPPHCTIALPLTSREKQILQLLGNGFSNKEIARDLSLSVATVKNHVHNILGKLQICRRAEAARWFRRQFSDTGAVARAIEQPRPQHLSEALLAP